MAQLINRIGKDELKKRLKEESFQRKTLSFYRYVNIKNPELIRDELYKQLNDLNCYGRIYIAEEGINAQMNVPENNWDAFVNQIYSNPYFKDVPFKMAVDGNGKSFYKLVIKVKKHIVADGINNNCVRIFNRRVKIFSV